MSEETTKYLPGDDLRLVLARLDSIDSRLTTLEQKVDARSYDTKPIWEQALKEIMETRAEVVKIDGRLDNLYGHMSNVENRLGNVEDRLGKIEGRLGNIENEIKDTRRMFRYTFSDLTRVHADIEERLDKIEDRERTR